MATNDITIQKALLNNYANFSLPTIESSINYWMVRTKQGFFYNEFISCEYIALAWNTIDHTTSLNNTESLSEDIVLHYPEIKRPTLVINKCNNFINMINEGDIIVIPSHGTEKITFAIAGEYYEEPSLSYDIEQDIINKIESGDLNTNDVRCPYKKRRKIKILKTIKGNELNFHLFRAITNYHGISNLKEYDTAILNHIYSNYIYKNDIHLTFNVRTEDEILMHDLSSFMFCTTSILSEQVNIPTENIKAKINLNSPGDIAIHINDAFQFMCANWKFFVFSLLALTGGSLAFGSVKIETPSVIKLIKDICTIKNDILLEKDKHALNLTEIEKNELDNIQKKLDIQKELKNQGIDLKALEYNFSTIYKSADKLKMGAVSNASPTALEVSQSGGESESKKKPKKKNKSKKEQ